MKQFIKTYILLLTSILSINAYEYTFTEEEIRGAENLDALVYIYRSKTKDIELNREEIIELAIEEWNEFIEEKYMALARKIVAGEEIPPAKKAIDTAKVTANSINYHLYGIMHGDEDIDINSEEGNMSNYLLMIELLYMVYAIRHNEHILGEQYFNYVLPLEFTDTPDHFIGVKNGVSHNLLVSICDNFSEIITNLFYSVDKEVFTQAMLKNPAAMSDALEDFPRHLWLELTIKENYTEVKSFELECTQRSLYMAGFLEGYAINREITNVAYFMGADHLPEVKSFLTNMSDLAKQREEYQLGFKHGQMSDEEIIEIHNQVDVFADYIRDIKNYPFQQIISAFAKSKAYYYLTSTRPTYKMYGLFLLLNHLQLNIFKDTSFSSILDHIDYFGLWTFVSGRFIDPYTIFPSLGVLYHSLDDDSEDGDSEDDESEDNE